jgi:hypothetical protein
MPKTDAPVVSMIVNLPGASAEEIETQLTKRIEAVNTIGYRRAARPVGPGQFARHDQLHPRT